MDFSYTPKSNYFWEDGIIAIVPDVEHEPANPKHPLNDQVERRAIAKAWEQQKVREYKVIVFAKVENKKARKYFQETRSPEVDGHQKLTDLHDRKLHFLTNYRPQGPLHLVDLYGRYNVYIMLKKLEGVIAASTPVSKQSPSLHCKAMTCIQDLPSELLLEVMEHCSSDLPSLIKAYPTALNNFSQNRKGFVARMSARFGDLALPSLVRAARLHYIRRQPDFEALHFIEIEARITTVCNITEETSFRERPSPTLPNLNGYSLLALSVMWELGEDAKRITDAYSQQALFEMAIQPDAEFYVPRQSAELTQHERRCFMAAAFIFEKHYREGEVHNYLHFLTSQGLNMLTALQKMSIDELTSFTITTFLHVNSSDRPVVLITRLYGYGPIGTGEVDSWSPWPYLDKLLDNQWEAYDAEEDWEDTWSRVIPFWDPSEDEDPYGRGD
ncbi:unnamed protein product, partial [Fusarium equiseti]